MVVTHLQGEIIQNYSPIDSLVPQTENQTIILHNVQLIMDYYYSYMKSVNFC